jgi:hypothetical protein
MFDKLHWSHRDKVKSKHGDRALLSFNPTLPHMRDIVPIRIDIRKRMNFMRKYG